MNKENAYDIYMDVEKNPCKHTDKEENNNFYAHSPAGGEVTYSML